MYSPELEAEALKTLDDRNGSCVIAARKPGAVRPKTIYRWMREASDPSRKRYAHSSAKQNRTIARQPEQGESAAKPADGYGVSITTVCNIRNGFREKGATAFMNVKESIEVPQVDPSDMPDDAEVLKKRRAELETDNTILKQTVERLKNPGADPSDLMNREKTIVVDA